MTYSLDEALPYVTGVKNGKTLYTTLPPKAKIEMAVCTHCPVSLLSVFDVAAFLSEGKRWLTRPFPHHLGSAGCY